MTGHEADQGGSLAEQLEAYQQDVGSWGKAHPGRENTIAERKSVDLIGRAVAALAIQQEASGLSDTEIINNALQGYGFIAAASRIGYEILLRDPADGSTSQILMFPAASPALEVPPDTDPQ